MAQVVIGTVDEFTELEPKQVVCAVGTLCVIRTADGFRALDDTCTHATMSLSDGDYYDDTDEIECPLHQSTFDCRTGEPTLPPATEPVAAYAVSVDGDNVVITT